MHGYIFSSICHYLLLGAIIDANFNFIEIKYRENISQAGFNQNQNYYYFPFNFISVKSRMIHFLKLHLAYKVHSFSFAYF